MGEKEKKKVYLVIIHKQSSKNGWETESKSSLFCDVTSREWKAQLQGGGNLRSHVAIELIVQELDRKQEIDVTQGGLKCTQTVK